MSITVRAVVETTEERLDKFPDMKRPLPTLALLGLALVPSVSTAQETPDTRATWFIFLETGKKTPEDKEAVMKMQKGHIANFGKLHSEKKLFAAGPLADPSKTKRGIVVVKANTREEYAGYFQADDYVREGYMTLNAEKATVQRSLRSDGIDPSGIEEVRIIQITRPAAALTAAEMSADHAYLRDLLDRGVVGAWYTLEGGAVAEVLFCRSTDTAALEATFAHIPSVKAAKAAALIWPQYIGKGVVP